MVDADSVETVCFVNSPWAQFSQGVPNSSEQFESVPAVMTASVAGPASRQAALASCAARRCTCVTLVDECDLLMGSSSPISVRRAAPGSRAPPPLAPSRRWPPSALAGAVANAWSDRRYQAASAALFAVLCATSPSRVASLLVGCAWAVAGVVRFLPPSSPPPRPSVAHTLKEAGGATAEALRRLLRVAQEAELYERGHHVAASGLPVPPASKLEGNGGGTRDAVGLAPDSPGCLARRGLVRAIGREKGALFVAFGHLLDCIADPDHRAAVRRSFSWLSAPFQREATAEQDSEQHLPRLTCLRMDSAFNRVLRSHVITALLVVVGCDRVRLGAVQPCAAARPVPACCEAAMLGLVDEWRAVVQDAQRAVAESARAPVQVLLQGAESNWPAAAGRPTCDGIVAELADLTAQSAGRAVTDVDGARQSLASVQALFDGAESGDRTACLLESRVFLSDARNALLKALRSVDQSELQLRRMQHGRDARPPATRPTLEPLELSASSPEPMDNDGVAQPEEFEGMASDPTSGETCGEPLTIDVAGCGAAAPASASVDCGDFEAVAGRRNMTASGHHAGRHPDQEMRIRQLEELQRADFEARLGLVRELQTVFQK